MTEIYVVEITDQDAETEIRLFASEASAKAVVPTFCAEYGLMAVYNEHHQQWDLFDRGDDPADDDPAYSINIQLLGVRP